MMVTHNTASPNLTKGPWPQSNNTFPPCLESVYSGDARHCHWA